MPNLAAGHRIGPYRIVRPLGEGGMGLVYEAVREDLGGRVALKVLRVEYAVKPEFAARFFNEARAANVIEHPGVARVFDYGQLPDGVPYLTMEYLDGESLARRQERLGRLATEEVLRIGRQIASAVAAAHAKQIVHRDLKPDNIMLVPDAESQGGDRVKVLDFGIAKLAVELYGSARTKTNVLLGTPIYMAPEQCRGAKGVGDKTDVYSLGVILYEMLAGRPPFVAEEPGEYIGMHMFKEPPPLQEFAPKVAGRLTSLVHAMLTKTYEQRPDMASVAQELRQLAQVNSESMPIFPIPKEPDEEDNNLTISIIKKKSAPKKLPVNDPYPTVRKPVPAILDLQSRGGPPPLAPPATAKASLEKSGQPASAQGPFSIDGPTQIDEQDTFLQVSKPSSLEPPTRNSGTPERQTAKSLEKIPKWLHQANESLAKGRAALKSAASTVRKLLRHGHADSARATKIVWHGNSNQLAVIFLGILLLGIVGLLIVSWVRKQATPTITTPAPRLELPDLATLNREPVTNDAPPGPTVPANGLSSSRKGKDSGGQDDKGPPKAPKSHSKWTAQEIKDGLALAQAQAKQKDYRSALRTARNVAEFGKEPAAWAMAGVYACTLQDAKRANEAVEQLAKKSGASDLLSSMLSACRSQGFNRGADGRLTAKTP